MRRLARLTTGLLAALLSGIGLSVALSSESETRQLPVIVTYELRLARIAADAASRDPRRFWIDQILARVEDKAARQPFHLDRPATVLLRFAVDRQGRLVSRAGAASSGKPEADAAAIRILADAAPFPPMPDVIAGRKQAFTLPMRFHWRPAASVTQNRLSLAGSGV